MKPTQLPATHTLVAPQSLPHAPQLVESVCRLAHAEPLRPLHLVSPCAQFDSPPTHAPFSHRFTPHALPHAPHVLGLLARFTQVLLQLVVCGSHRATHLPLTQ